MGRTRIKEWLVGGVLAFMLCCHVSGFARNDNESRFLKNTRQLIYTGQRSGEGYFSPDGKALIFQSEREPGNPFFQIYLLDLETGRNHLVSTGRGKTTCSYFKPHSDRVLFSSSHLDPRAETKQQGEFERRASGKSRRYSWDYDIYMDIFTASRDGSGLTRLTTAKGYDAEASYSPDGSQIVFCSLRQAYTKSLLSEEDRQRLERDPSYFGEIYIMQADGSHQKRLTHTPGYDGGPFFSPDGQRIIWRRFQENGAVADVYTMRLDGLDVRQLTDFGAMSWAPYYHPSGEYVLFASNKLGFSNFEIYMVDAQGKHEPVRITFTDGFDGLPVFSPDGTRMSWTSNRTPDKKSQIFLAEWQHEAALSALRESPLRAHGQSATQVHGDEPPEKDEKEDDIAAANQLFSPQIKQTEMAEIVRFLASDSLKGRMSGSPETRLAAHYIIRRLQEAGVKPFGQNGGFLREFEFTSGIKLRKATNRLEVAPGPDDGSLTFEVNADFRPLSFSLDGEVEGDVVFAGYGLSVPGGQGEGFDSYHDLNVKDKIVLVLRYVPEAVTVARRQQLNRYAGLRYKALIARERGAKGLLVVVGPNSPRAGQLIPLSFDNSPSNSGIVAASISASVADALLRNSGKTLKEVQEQLDQENPHYEGRFSLPGVKVRLRTGLERIKKSDFNVVGILRARKNAANKTIVLGAHYDHIGLGEIGSLAGKGEEGQIHNGADDNASGVSTVLELAASLSDLQKQEPQRFRQDIVFAFWSGEELGIIGSSAFVANPPLPLDSMKAYINFDMVGRLRENKLILQGTGSSSVWKKLVERYNVAAGFNLVLQDDPYQPTDVTAFYPQKIPVLSFFTGSHENYHRPGDDIETLQYAGMERIAKFARAIVLDLVERPVPPDYQKVEQTKSQAGGRESMRAYLGTIPDYTGGDTGGVKLSGVSSGGPADAAGLKSGDVIVELAGQDVKNIYDYTYAIDALKIGEAAKVVVLRDEQRIALSIVPEARE